MATTNNNIQQIWAPAPVQYPGQGIAIVEMSNKKNLVLPPSADQMFKINVLLSNDEGWCAIITKTYQCIMENSVARKRMTDNCLGAFIGGGMLVASILLGGSSSRPPQPTSDNQASNNAPPNSQQPNQPKEQEGVLWKQLGMVLFGGICTSLVTAFWTSRSIVLSQDYVEWRYTAIIKNIFTPYKQFLQSSRLNRFLCPITLDLPEIAVKDPNPKADKWWELSAITYHIQTTNREREEKINREPTAALQEAKKIELEVKTSPLRNCDLQLKDLKFDINFYVEISKEILEILKTNLEEQNRQGLISYYTNLEKNSKALSKVIREELYQKLLEGVITDEDHTKAVKACRYLYDSIPSLESRGPATVTA